MADENGTYHVYTLKPLTPEAAHLPITTLHRTRPEGPDPGSDRAEWFVIAGTGLVTAQTASYRTAPASPIQIFGRDAS